MIKSSEPRTIGNFTIGKVIGSGSFGKVRQGIHIPTQQKVAVKLLQKKKITSIKDIERIRKQLQILKNLTHPNILKLLQVKQTQKYIAIFTQIVQGQELYDLIVRKGKLQIDEAHKYFCQLFQAVRFLHERKIAHRDIKPQNIIIGRNGELKLIDFGLSTEWEHGKTMMQTPCGSPCYAAPEMVLGKRYDTRKVDIWAAGVTLYAMLVGRLPFQHDNTLQLYKLIATTQFQEVKGVPSYVNLLLKAMIQKDPKKRISIKSLSENIWLKDSTIECQSTLTNQQHNQSILSQMSQQFNLSIDQLKLTMQQNPISELSTFYYLKTHSMSSEMQSEQFHDGSFHLEFVFKSYELIEAYLQKNELTYCWGVNKQPELNKVSERGEQVSSVKKYITVEGKLFTVKRLKNLPKLIYLPLNGIKLKTKNPTLNFFTKSNERSMTNLDSSRSNLDRLCVQTF